MNKPKAILGPHGATLRLILSIIMEDGPWIIFLHNTLKNGCGLAQALACVKRDMRFVHPSVRA